MIKPQLIIEVLDNKYIVNEYDVNYVDMYASRFGLLVLYKYYNSDKKLIYHELKIFDSVDGTFLDIRNLSTNIGLRNVVVFFV